MHGAPQPTRAPAWSPIWARLPRDFRCALAPLGPDVHKLSRFKGWIKLYGIATSNLDVWLLSLARVVTVVGLLAWLRSDPPKHRRHGPSYGAPDAPNAPQVASGPPA